nr:DUF6048 family protein [uncultured Bacteroides sp.]
MKKKIFASIISALALFVVSFPVLAQQQQQRQVLRKGQKKVISKIPKEVLPLYNGTFVGVDLYGIGSKAFGGDFLSSEVSVDVNLKNRFFPVVELGYGKVDKNNNNISYKSSAPYFRIGMDYNLMFKKKSLSHMYIGARYGFTALSYDVKSTGLDDDIYPGEVPFEYTGEKTTAHWMELVGGIRAEVFKNVLMGWSLRYKAKISVKDNVHSTPWYIPGFGENKSSTFGITYSLIYKLPF